MLIVRFMQTCLPYSHLIMHIAVSQGAMKSYRFLSPAVSNKRKVVRDRSLFLLTPLWNMLFSQVGPLSPSHFSSPDTKKEKENAEYCWPLFAIQNRKPKAKLFLSLTLPILFKREKKEAKISNYTKKAVRCQWLRWRHTVSISTVTMVTV